MIKAASIPLSLILLLITAPSSWSQAPGPDDPVAEGVKEGLRRQAARISLREKLILARSAQNRGDLPTAAKLYDEAWDLVTFVGPSADAERQQTMAGLAVVRLELASQNQRRNNFKEAKTQVD